MKPLKVFALATLLTLGHGASLFAQQPNLYRPLSHRQLPQSQKASPPTGVVGVTWSPPLRCVRQTDCPPHSGCQSCAVATTPLFVTAAPRHCLWAPLPAPTQTSIRPLPV